MSSALMGYFRMLLAQRFTIESSRLKTPGKANQRAVAQMRRCRKCRFAGMIGRLPG